jgi:hypothetical protein
MTPLRLPMIEEMMLAGLAPTTQAVYIQAVRQLAAHYGRSPDRLSEEEVRAYLVGLRKAASHAAPSRRATTAFSSSTGKRSISIGHCFQKKDPPAQAEALTQCAGRRPSPPSSRPHKEPNLQGLLQRHVCLRLAGRGGNGP